MRAWALVASLQKHFYRSDLARALWGQEPWNAARINPIIEALLQQGRIIQMHGQTRGGWHTVKYEVVGAI